MRCCCWPLLAALSLGILSSPAAYAARFGLLVAHDLGGSGQQPLAHSEDDAERMRRVLTELGDFRSNDVKVVHRPSRRELASQLRWLEERVEAAQAAGEPTVALFYYTGHARSAGLSLGSEILPLDDLREQLQALPAEVRIVILDACQSGRFSSVKGAVPAPEFALRSVEQLDLTGLAVLASSTADELSQESGEIRGSFFTHHLVTGLWGPADEDNDGKVSLEEAYAYAYHRTVLSTSATRVGRQHPTMELEVKGHGRLVLTQPRRAESVLAVPGEVDTALLLFDREGRVWGEVDPRGEAIRVGLPAGEYQAILREEGTSYTCPISLEPDETSIFDREDCVRVEAAESLSKRSPPWWDPWLAEATLGFGVASRDRYVETLAQFGYGLEENHLRFSVRGGLRLHPNFEVLLGLERLGGLRGTRSGGDAPGRIEYDAYATVVAARGQIELFNFLVPYVEVGAGLAWARVDIQGDASHAFGLRVGVGAGLRIELADHFGLLTQLDLIQAQVLRNDLDEVHDVGSAQLILGVRIHH